MNVLIRLERPGEEDEIAELIQAAFEELVYSSHTEHRIVDTLREAGQLTVSLVAIDDEDDIVGHVAASPVVISDGSANWYGIGPVSVWPSCQGRGIGAKLMHEVLARLKELGAAGCVVLGDPGFYSRFGFVPLTTLVLPGVEGDYFQVLAFGDQVPSGEVAYHPAFSA